MRGMTGSNETRKRYGEEREQEKRGNPKGRVISPRATQAHAVNIAL